MLGLTAQEISQLVGEAVWARTPLVSDQAQIPNDLAFYIQMALNGVEVTEAAQAAAEAALGTARQATVAQQAATTTPTPPTGTDECQAPPNKHARRSTDTEDGNATDMEM